MPNGSPIYLRDCRTVTLGELRTFATAAICTIQRERVVDRFKPGETHYQLWQHTAPGDQALDERHRRVRAVSDAWMGSQFEFRMGRAARGPLMWLYLDEDHLLQNLDRTRKHDDECVVRLCVPVRELLFSKRVAWQRLLMAIEGDPLDALLGSSSGIASADEIGNDWETEVFDTSDSDEMSTLQAVIDRIEPTWLRGVAVLGPRTTS